MATSFADDIKSIFNHLVNQVPENFKDVANGMINYHFNKWKHMYNNNEETSSEVKLNKIDNLCKDKVKVNVKNINKSKHMYNKETNLDNLCKNKNKVKIKVKLRNTTKSKRSLLSCKAKEIKLEAKLSKVNKLCKSKIDRSKTNKSKSKTIKPDFDNMYKRLKHNLKLHTNNGLSINEIINIIDSEYNNSIDDCIKRLNRIKSEVYNKNYPISILYYQAGIIASKINYSSENYKNFINDLKTKLGCCGSQAYWFMNFHKYCQIFTNLKYVTKLGNLQQHTSHLIERIGEDKDFWTKKLY